MNDRFARPLDIFIGYDAGEAIAYHVCVNSLIRHSSQPLRITPLALNNLAPHYTEKHSDGSTAFAYSRFLVPYLMGFSGTALFLDGDMVVKDDIAKLFDEFYHDTKSAVAVVKHPEYIPRATTKFRGAIQSAYPKKNWSSVMMFRCSHSYCKQLTPDYIERAEGRHLHRFEWLPEERVGELAPEWNHLVGQYEHNDKAHILHFTDGVPAFKDYADCDHSAEWWDEMHRTTSVDE
jgi:lipopolysaccharide biosynthesis glycosyltransferase